MEYQINSKLVKPGDIFIALKGTHYDGHDFILDAINNGASKIICEKKYKDKKLYKYVKNTKNYLTKIISKENKKLSKNFTIVGITGTKGKTTTCHFIYQFLNCLKTKCAYIGTLGLIYNNNSYSLNNTTPDILTINKILKKLYKENITHIVMEVSSISLIEKRIKGLKFKIAGFTNFSQDHLDYHITMDNYFKAKSLITKYTNGLLVINSDDNSFSYLKRIKASSISIGLNGDYKIKYYELNENKSYLTFEYNYEKYSININFIGKYNIYNFLMALAIVNNIGYDINEILNVSKNILPVKGRNELIEKHNKYVIIDYAHSPESVKETLVTYNELKKGKVITILGCGGQRDKLKRPIMGSIATKYSDYVIFTSDNPRDENPLDILNDITKDLIETNYEIIENRSKAIKKGVKLLKKNDYLLILGKGHENYQIINNVKYPFDDKIEVLKYL